MGFVLASFNWELQKSFPSFLLAFFLIFHLLFLHSSGSSCPSSFDCGPLGQMKFPFTNLPDPQCGLCTLSCHEKTPKVFLGDEGRSIQVDDINEDVIKISDPFLQYLIDNKNCNFFSYVNPPYTPYISYTISPNLTFVQCLPSNPEHKNQTDLKYFSGNYTRYSGEGCHGNIIYFSFPNNTVPPLSSFPRNCASFQLPIVSSVEDRNLSDPFSLLTANFSIEYHVSKECQTCLANYSQCLGDNREFHCLNKKRGIDEIGGTGADQKKKIRGQSHLRLILGIVVSTVGIMAILLFCIIIKKLAQSKSIFFWETNTENYRNIEAFLRNCGSLSPKRYTYSDIKSITNSFRTKLGQGGFGCVFKGKLENGSLVAVKVLKGLKGNGDEFINEVATISRTSHVNIVTLLGFCFEGAHRALIYEFMPNGSLDKFIYHGGSLTYRQLGWEALYQIAVGIARGLEYLHRGCNTRILHFDIKPHNILLNESFCPKISDFGLAKLCPQKESIISLLGARGTTGYIAPEVFSRNFGGVSHKSDVYSYGMMVLEMVGGRKNIRVEVDRTSEIYFPHWVYKRLELDEELGLHGIMDDEANSSAKKMIIVGLWCIQTDPSHRPSMSRVVEMLEGSPESLLIPPKPFLSSPSRPSGDSSTTHVMTLGQCMHVSTG